MLQGYTTEVTRRSPAPLIGPGPSTSNPLVRLRTALGLLIKHHDQMNLQMASAFLAVALYPESSLVELGEITGLRQQTVSRHMQDLGAYQRLRTNLKGEPEKHRRKGLGLIEVTTDQMDSRKKHYSLTREGKALATLLSNLIDKPR